MQARRKRFTADARSADEAVASFLKAARTGDVDTLIAVLSHDVVQVSDGGGEVRAARKPIFGPEQVARFVKHLASGEMGQSELSFGRCNATPTVLFSIQGQLHTALLFEVTGTFISALYAVRNPSKLSAAQRLHRLAR